MSSEDWLSPFAPPSTRGVVGQPVLSWEDSPFVPSTLAPVRATELDEAFEAGSLGVAESASAVEAREAGWSEAEEERWPQSESDDREEGGVDLAQETSALESIGEAAFEGITEQVSELGRLSDELERVSQQLDGTPATESDITDVIEIGKGIGRLGQALGAAFTGGSASAAADQSVAVPPFNFITRLSMPVPLLSAASNADALRWNNRNHPTTSGVSPNDIRTDIARYVNLTAIGAAIQNFNLANPTKAIQLGTPPMDAVLVEALHQFQAKCFFESGQIDGKAGESTLDSLGLVKRTGMNSVDTRNAGAHGRLGQVDVAGLTNNEFTADTWFDHMVNPSFLGWRFLQGGNPRGVHLSFMRKLRVAERALLAQSRFSGKTPVELGKALGFSSRSEEHKGARPTSTTASMHNYGLAVDIKYTPNPWVKGADFTRALKNAALLTSGVRITQATSQRFLHDLGADATLTTARIFDTLSQRNRDFREYLTLDANPAGITPLLQSRRADGTPGVFANATETIAQAAQRWRTKIRDDLANMRAQGSPFRPTDGAARDPLLGFLNLDRDLVIALRDSACLAWGAVDIGHGAGGSGDMMHFDDRVCGIGGALADVGANTRPQSGHPCVACAAAPNQELESFEDSESEHGRFGEAANTESRQDAAAEIETDASYEDASFRRDDIYFENVDYEFVSEIEQAEEEDGGIDVELEDAVNASYEDEESSFEGERFTELLARLFAPGDIVQRAQKVLGAGLFGMSLLSRFGSGQIWNEDHLALEVLFQQQPNLKPSDLDRLTGSERLKRLRGLAIKHQRSLTSIREGVVRPIFGRPSNFQIQPAEGCSIQDLRAEVRKLGPLKGGVLNGKVWYKRSAGASPRKQSAVDSIVLHHMAYNIGNNVKSYLKVGAHYAVLADGQIAQLYDDLDFMNASNGFNPRSVAIEFAGNFPTHSYHWWKSKELTIPDRCYLTPAQIRAGRCLLATLKARLPGIQYVYAHRQSSDTRENDPGPDVWLHVAEWAINTLGLTDRLPQTHVGKGQPIPDSWRRARAVIAPVPVPATPAKSGGTVPQGQGTGAAIGTSGKKLMVAVSGLNVRSSPSIKGTKVGSLSKGEIVDWLDSSADRQWFKVQRGSLLGWSFAQYLTLPNGQRAATPAAPPAPNLGPLDSIVRLAATSPLARVSWGNRGVAPPGYVKGMALVYARVYCKLKAGDAAAVEMAKAVTRDPLTDALAHYAAEFKALGMSNASAGVDTLRHLFTLLYSLGMRESSGNHCAGRYTGDQNTSAATAEAGLFQASYNLQSSHRTLPDLFKKYSDNPAGFLDVFREGARCKASDATNYGTGAGRDYQQLAKTCPAFAAEFAAVGLRNRRRHWGPINEKTALLRPECDALFLEIQKLVDSSGLCPSL
jgi:hypothetical protein